MRPFESQTIPVPMMSLSSRCLLAALLTVAAIGASCPDDGPRTRPEDILACAAIEGLLADTAGTAQTAPLFRQRDGACAEVPVAELDGLGAQTLFADDACTDSVSFRGSSFLEFCTTQLLGNDVTRDFLGNPAGWSDVDVDPNVGERTETYWTLAREATLQAGALDPTEVPRPYVRRVEYRRVGECSLGMRVYVPHPGAGNLKAAMVIHGGGWRFRGAGAVVGLGVTAPQLTSRGYAVFAPFHRLTGESDGPAACRGADGEDVIEDVTAALDWVLANGVEFGVDPGAGGVSLVGQSSGGHLAALLATERPDDVERALLLYPLVDVPFIIEQLGEGGIFAGRFERGEQLLLAFVDEEGVSAGADLDAESPFAQRNSFVRQIQADPDRFGELYMIHGDADTQVPVELSVRLCAARDAARTPDAAAYVGGDADLDCGGDSFAVVVAGAEHILDLRCFSGDRSEFLNMAEDELQALCTAGSPQQQERVRQALLRAYERFE